MAKAKKPGSGLLTRSRSITGKSALTKQKTLKPEHTRQIIRRFHVLQKSKHKILTKLGISPGFFGESYDKLKKDNLYQIGRAHV